MLRSCIAVFLGAVFVQSWLTLGSETCDKVPEAQPVFFLQHSLVMSTAIDATLPRQRGVTKCLDNPGGQNYCSGWCNTAPNPPGWGCGVATHDEHACDCTGCNGCGACDASIAPANGAVGNCTSELASGATCQPACDAGYRATTSSSCFAAELTAAVCELIPVAAVAAAVSLELPTDGGDWVTVTCDGGQKILGGGCIATGSPHRFQASMPAGDKGWKCGGLGGAKSVSAMCISEELAPLIKFAGGGDWTTATCDDGQKILGGGCEAAGSPYSFEASKPNGDNAWVCGGHGGAKRVYAMCVPETQAPVIKSSQGGDWTTVFCDAGQTILGGGCSAIGSPHAFSASFPDGNNSWTCGGLGGSKEVYAICTPPTTTTTTTTTTTLPTYAHPFEKGGCCLEDGQFHERCFKRGTEIAVCKRECDKDPACVGFVQARHFGCQYATTSECLAPGFRKYNKGTVGPIEAGPFVAINYDGCYIKQATSS